MPSAGLIAIAAAVLVFILVVMNIALLGAARRAQVPLSKLPPGEGAGAPPRAEPVPVPPVTACGPAEPVATASVPPVDPPMPFAELERVSETLLHLPGVLGAALLDPEGMVIFQNPPRVDITDLEVARGRDLARELSQGLRLGSADRLTLEGQDGVAIFQAAPGGFTWLLLSTGETGLGRLRYELWHLVRSSAAALEQAGSLDPLGSGRRLSHAPPV